MLDGDFTEDNYPNNPSCFINISNCNAVNGYFYDCFIALSNNVNISNFNGNNFSIKNSNNITYENININNFINEINNSNLIINNSHIININTGSRSNTKFTNCSISNFIVGQYVHDVFLINCTIDKFENSYVTSNSAYNIFMDNCLINSKCNLQGIKNSILNIITNCSVYINNLHNSICQLLIKNNTSQSIYNIRINNATNNKIYYNIYEEIETDAPLYNELSSTNALTNTIIANKIYNSNNPNKNYTISFSKNNAPPADGLHYLGEIVLNTTPVSNGYVGWICVTSGTPGNWKGFGLIQT